MGSPVSFLTPELGALPVPDGDPDALHEAARVFLAAADAMADAGDRVATTADGVTGGSWFGFASLAFRAATGITAGDSRTAASAFRTAGSALQTLSAELRQAQELARRAQAQAAELNERSARLDVAASEAEAADNAARAAGKPTGPSELPGLIAQAGALRLESLGVAAQAASAEEQAQAAARRAAAAFDEVAAMAPSVRRAAEARARAEAEQKDDGGILGTIGAPFRWVGSQLWSAGEGAVDAVKDPLVMAYHLTPLHDGWTESWQDLGNGLAYGVTHPVEFGKAVIGVDVLEERGVAYWLGNLVPTAAATILSGGAAGGARAASATTRVVENAEDVADAARDLDRAGDAAQAGRAAAGLSFMQTAAGRELVRNTADLRGRLAAPNHEWEFNLVRPGPLTDEGASAAALRASPAQTFAGGKYDMVALDQPYVVFKAGDSPKGRFFSLDPPLSEAQVRIDSAVKPVWTAPDGSFLGSSPLEKGYAFVVENPQRPLPMGPVADQGGIYLGGRDRIQVFIDDRSASQLRLVEEWPLDNPPAWTRELQRTSP